MKYFKSLQFIVLFSLFACSSLAQGNFNGEWRFKLVDSAAKSEDKFDDLKFDDSSWDRVSLPHTAHLEPLVTQDQWQGICWYRKSFDVADYSDNSKYFIEFEAAMNHTTIWINGSEVMVAQGGYLPVVVDATPYLKSQGNVIALRLDNRDNAVTGPKPMKILDFNMYGGLYRNANLITKNKTYITHPIAADRVASGGVFVTYPEVSEQKSTVKVQTHVANENSKGSEFKVLYRIYDGKKLVKSEESVVVKLDAYANQEVVSEIEMPNAKLWSPDAPNLYRLEVQLLGDNVQDQEEVRFGIRKLEFRDNQLYINGKKSYLRGVNRHQEYPYIGYALSDNAQYRDAKRIKDAGFDYVRLSHYPQSPAFMDACDELGLMVADAILGWQFFKSNYAFKNHSYESARDLVRRDRNHPCVLAWEVSLNESSMPVSFMKELHDIVHEEYPGENVFTCGWRPQVYDIFFQARQHRIPHPHTAIKTKPYMVSEYGDWEYYSTDAGLNQHKLTKTKRLELSSRQLRANGEVALLQQAHNVQEAHNDNLSIHATGDSYWVMYDYNRGSSKDIESSGIMDLFRLPKFAYHFYRSQRDVASDEDIELKIATYWNKLSPTDIKVFSNCDEVKLYLNSRLIASQKPDQDSISANLNHPPFTFKVGKFRSGTLRAEGFIDGNIVAESKVRTPGKPVALKCWVAECGVTPQAGCNDVVFVHVAAVDKHGTICPDYTQNVEVDVDSKSEVMNTDGVKCEAGIATALVRIGSENGVSQFSATSGDLQGACSIVIR